MRYLSNKNIRGRFRNGSLAALFIAIQIGIALTPFVSVGTATAAAPGPITPGKVWICHATNSVTNPYNAIEVDYSAVDGNGGNDHSSHNGPAATSEAVAQSLKNLHIDWGDIIPPVIGVTFGQNWIANPSAQDVWNNNCSYPSKGTVELKKVWSGTPSQTTLKIGTSANGSQVASQLTGTNGTAPLTTSAQLVNAGTYYLSETALANYASQLTCFNDANNSGAYENEATVAVGQNGSVAVATGQHVICTFTNTRDRGTIELKKVWTGTAGQTTLNIGTSAGGTQVDSQQTGANGAGPLTTGQNQVDTGTYYVSEANNPGYTASLTCFNDINDNGTLNDNEPGVAANQGAVAVSKGQHVICTFTNTRDRGTIELKKVWVGATSQTTLKIGTTNGGSQVDQQLTTNNTLTTGQNQVDTGTYYVSESAIAGYSSALECKNGNTVVAVGQNNTVLVGTNQNIVCTFTNTQLKGNISIKKYNVNADGTITANTPTLSNWAFFIDSNNNGIKNNGEQDDDTNGSGVANFNNLTIGDYRICEQVKDGWMKIVPQNNSTNCTTVTVTADQTTTVNFGNFKKGKISGYKFHDLNGNGFRDGIGILAEPKIDDWNIYLYKDGSQVPTQTTETSSSFLNFGNYEFSNLTPGTYKVCEENPVGWQQIVPNPNVDPCYTFVINQSGQTETANFGNRAIGTIQVIKNVDTTGNGTPEILNSSDWSWNYIGTAAFDTNIQTGSAPVTVPTGLLGHFYLIGENQKTGYDLTDIDCNVSFLQIGDTAKVFIKRGDNVVCTFTNTKRADVTITKDAYPADGTDFDFTLSKHAPNDDDKKHGLNWIHQHHNDDDDFQLDDEGNVNNDDNVPGSKSFKLKAGTYYVTEQDIPEDWELTDISCTGAEYQVQGDTVAINVEKGTEVNCTFTNEKDSEVIVQKYNDQNRNGEFDNGEELLPDWEFTLANDECELELLPRILDNNQIFIDDCDSNVQKEITDEDGIAIFENVKPDDNYTLTETIPEDSNWNLGSIDCGAEVGSLDGDTYYFDGGIGAGQTIYCYVGNYRDAALNITKSNDQPAPVKTGATVTYTLTVTVPEDSGALFETEVTDLPPEGFTYVPGSWTVSSDMPIGEVPEPTYGSPGVWKLGNLLPGQIVTLTYKTIIGTAVSNGLYPDVAFARACSVQNNCFGQNNAVFANVVTTSNSPFVGTTVAVTSAATPVPTITRYVNTGASDVWMNALAAITIAGAALITLVRREQKGAK